MKICLIHPPQAFAVGSATMKRPTLPLGIAYVAASLREAGHEVQIVDAVGLAPEELRPFNDRIWLLGLSEDEMLDRIDPDVGMIGVGMMFSFNWPFVRTLARPDQGALPRHAARDGGGSRRRRSGTSA